MFRAYGASAANAELPTDTVVEVIYNHIKQMITINNRHNTTGYRLDLSEDAARLLGIEEEGVVDCAMQVPLMRNCMFLRGFLIMSPVILSAIGFVLFNKYA